MSTITATQIETATSETGTAKRPLRFKIGVALLVLYPFLYLVVPIAPFLPLETAAKAAVVGAVIGAAEVVLLIAIALMGKEAYDAIRSRIRTWRRTNAGGAA